MRKAEKVVEFEQYEIYRFTPSLFDLFGEYYPEKITFRRIIRFLLALPDGYEIYSLVDGSTAIGYCTVQNGKCPRFDYSTERDIIVGPYVIVPDYQGKGLAAKLIQQVLTIKKGKYQNAFAYIKKENIPSTKTVEKLGFSFYSNATVKKITANVKLSKSKDANYSIFYYRGKKK